DSGQRRDCPWLVSPQQPRVGGSRPTFGPGGEPKSTMGLSGPGGRIGGSSAYEGAEYGGRKAGGATGPGFVSSSLDGAVTRCGAHLLFALLRVSAGRPGCVTECGRHAPGAPHPPTRCEMWLRASKVG